MYMQKGCDSPSIAVFNANTIWNAQSVKVFLLQHNTPVPPGQFNDMVVRVPKHNLLCSRRGCRCLKQHLQTLDKKKINILHILVEEKKVTVLRSVFAKDDKRKAEKDFAVYHLPKSQMKFLTEFNDCRTQTVGDLSMYV